MSGIVTLTTDFGTRDPYVAAMKGQILSMMPSCTLVDVTHDVPLGNILRGALAVRDVAEYFPPGTVHLVVVDPGVGTARRGMVLDAGGFFAVGPDNGVLSLLWEGRRDASFREIEAARVAPRPVADTFHGRDIFAPTAASLASGIPARRVGPAFSDPVRLELPRPSLDSDGAVRGQVLYHDSYGNLITNIRRDHLPAAGPELLVEVGERLIHGLVRSYAAGPRGLVALVGSTGLLEVALRDGSAHEHLGVGFGAPVRVRHLGPSRGAQS